MKSLLMLIILPPSLLAAAALAATEPSELDLGAAAMAGTEASFDQKFTPKGFTHPQSESGTVVFGTLPMMRWSYTTPEVKLFVFDGHKSWLYVPEDKQVTVAELTEVRKKDLPFLLIGDPAARARSFTTKEERHGDEIATTLAPRDPSSQIRKITVTTSASDHHILRVEYTDREGNQTTFALTDIKKKTAGADAFHFTPPAGVQVIMQ